MAMLVRADLRFEWVLSLCMVLALGAVFAPLFILLGLQEGIVGGMIDQLQRDPLSRLVTPKFQLQEPLDDQWLASLRQHASALVGSPTSHLLLDVQGLSDPVNAIPTSRTDPLLTENGIILPAAGRNVVLSEPLARSLARKAGDVLGLMLVRAVRQEERVPLELLVAGVLPKAASEDFKIWLPEGLFEQIYHWRGGQAAPELGLGGRGAELVPEYDGILTLLDEVPSEAEYRQMIGGRRLSFTQLPQAVDASPWGHAGRPARLWKPVGSRVLEQDFAPLANRHHELGHAVELLPHLEDFQVVLRSRNSQKTLPLILLPLEPEGGRPTVDGRQPAWISEQDGFPLADDVELVFSSGSRGREVAVPVALRTSSQLLPGHVAVRPDFAGRMNAARRQEAAYDRGRGEFLLAGKGMRFFRAYAESIDGLDALVELVRREGVRRASNALLEPSSRLAEVRNVRRLAGYMEKLYLLILSVSGVSGFFAIAASVYAGIQRKRRDLAYLELFGLHPATLVVFPFLKSLVLVSCALAVALAAYAVFGRWADRLFADVLGDAASLTRLDGRQLLMLVGGVYVAASLASLLAASAVTRIEPGEYIRE